MVRLLAVALTLLFAQPAQAAAPEKKTDVGQYVELLPVGLPVIAGGRLVNYVFVYVRLNLTSGANAARLREKEPHFRDALVRAAHRTPFTVADDYGRIDAAKLSAALHREASRIAGPNQVQSVVVTSQQPRRRVAAPRA
jgi:flagellar basal body-associated protein FliL